MVMFIAVNNNRLLSIDIVFIVTACSFLPPPTASSFAPVHQASNIYLRNLTDIYLISNLTVLPENYIRSTSKSTSPLQLQPHSNPLATYPPQQIWTPQALTHRSSTQQTEKKSPSSLTMRLKRRISNKVTSPGTIYKSPRFPIHISSR